MYEQTGLSIDRIATELKLDTGVVKKLLNDNSAKYREAVKAELMAKAERLAQDASRQRAVAANGNGGPAFNGDSGSSRRATGYEVDIRKADGVPLQSAITDEEYRMVCRGLLELALSSPDEHVRIKASNVLIKDKRNNYSQAGNAYNDPAREFMQANVQLLNEAIRRARGIGPGSLDQNNPNVIKTVNEVGAVIETPVTIIEEASVIE